MEKKNDRKSGETTCQIFYYEIIYIVAICRGGKMLEYIILGILFEGPATGYEIRKNMEQGIGMFYKASFGSIYPLLARLSESGDIANSDEQETITSRNKKEYHITESGKGNFWVWLGDLENTGNSMEAFMAKVYFYDHLLPEEASQGIAVYEEKLRCYLQELLKKSEAYKDAENGCYHRLSTLYFGICKLQSMIQWCEVVRNKESMQDLVQSLNISPK